MSPGEITTPGLHCIVVRHDAWCPGARGEGHGCICNAVAEIVDEKTMAEVMTKDFRNRAQRRAAAKKKRKGQP